MKHKRLLLVLVVLVLASLACNLLTGGGSAGLEEDTNSPGETGGSGESDSPSTSDDGEESEAEESLSEPGDSDDLDSDFPLPDDVQNFMQLDENSINYQTSMSMEEVVDFYRDAFASAGYTERDLLAVIEDSTISLVWDGHPSGQAIIVQGVDLGNGTINVNVRLEDI